MNFSTIGKQQKWRHDHQIKTEV